MDWNLFWTAFGAIGTTIGSFATAAAVVVALWQTKFAYKKKVRITFEENSMIQVREGSGLERVIVLRISNVGNRDITLNSISIQIEGSYTIALLPEYLEYKTIKLPWLLSVEKTAEIIMKYSEFIKNLSDIILKDKNVEDKEITIVVTDSVGEKYALKLERTPKMYVEKQ